MTAIRVHYPPTSGRLVLRAEPDRERDIEPTAVSAAGDCYEFALPLERAFRYFKPVLRETTDRWSMGANYLAIEAQDRDVYPFFAPDAHCSECELRELADESGRSHRFRVFYPPGYFENPLRRYPVLYMQDGPNLFFPGEAFGGRHWRIAETLRVLDAMNAVEQLIVVGIYPNERELDYTLPGYGPYGRFLARTLKPRIDADYRTLRGPGATAVMGSSLGGVASLYLAWEFPAIFGAAACLSSTFGWRDDLRERIAAEPRRELRLYLDSGWPQDNYEVTRAMWRLLAGRGYRPGTDLHYLCFPEALHGESHWAMRAHLPLQLLFGSER